VRAQETGAVQDSPELATVVVSARRRAEPEVTVPSSVTTFRADTLADFDIRSFGDYAAMTPDLSYSYGGGPTGITTARTVAIRGISGQNLTGTAGATGLYLDDTPVPASVDPRVVDIRDIEVLKGPQGTLYGESALGGNVRLVINPPELNRDSFSYVVDAGGTDRATGADVSGNAVANLVFIPGQFALRAVAFDDHGAGYLTRTYPDAGSAAQTDPFLRVPRTPVADQGAADTFGGSLTALWQATGGLTLQWRLLGEQQTYNGFPAAFAPLPQFRPGYSADRAFDVQPRATDAWTLWALEVAYRAAGWRIVSSSSVFDRNTRDIEDSTYGTQQVLSSVYGVSGVPPQPFLWVGEHSERQVTSETRWSFDPVRQLSGTVGVFYSDARTGFGIPPTNATGVVAATAGNDVTGPATSDLLWTQSDPGRQQDASVFGELYYQVLQKLSLTAGIRRYWLRQYADYTADGYLNLGATASDPQRNSQRGTDPRFALSWQVHDVGELYLSASKGFRAGGAQPYAPFCTLPDLPVEAISRVRSDTLWSYEAGGKLQLRDPDLLLTVAAYHVDWRNPQQQVALPCGAYFEINGNAARISGAEAEIVGQVLPGLQIRLGAGYEHALITDPGALADAGVLAGTRIAGIPAWTATAGATYRWPFADGSAFVTADASHTGDSISLLNGGAGVVATRPAYSLVNLRIGLQRPSGEWSIGVRNLTGARPNLGDLGYVGYAQHDPGGAVIPQVATLPPLTVSLQWRQSF
jgi:iron complex outermembrane recepter protein